MYKVHDEEIWFILQHAELTTDKTEHSDTAYQTKWNAT